MDGETMIFGRAFGCIMLFILVGILSLVVPLNKITRKNAEHIGYITAVEDNTGWFPDHTTTIYVKTELSSSQEDTYCIQDDQTEVINKAKEFARSKTNVVVRFEGREGTGLFNCTGDVITNIESTQQPNK